MTDLFAHRAKEYDNGSRRVANVMAIVESIKKNSSLTSDMHLMDFGAGTGLLLKGIAPYVKKITAVDVSASMVAVLEEKRDELPCELAIVQADMTIDDVQSIDKFSGTFSEKFDGIISSMTMHHIKDTPAIFAKFKSLLKPNGFIAIADLDTEDGSFHSKGAKNKDTGVFHNGFDRAKICQIATEAGFDNVQVCTANEFVKSDIAYSVFLLTAVG